MQVGGGVKGVGAGTHESPDEGGREVETSFETESWLLIAARWGRWDRRDPKNLVVDGARNKRPRVEAVEGLEASTRPRVYEREGS
jgi:hypothetical protein